MKKILFVFGTRPEAIKMAPLVKLFQKNKLIKTIVCITSQHRAMLDQVLDFFEIKPDYDLNLMKKNQSLFDITSLVLEGLQSVISKCKPDVLIVQGDTTTAFAGALAGFYSKIKVAHLEAGLRSYDKYSPYPEEINRVLISKIADFHFAPTKLAFDCLKKEGIKTNIWQVGNSVIDALLMGIELVKKNEVKYLKFFKNIDFKKRIILVTGHRRESFGKPFLEICSALKEIAKFENVEIVYPVHLNPQVQDPVQSMLANIANIHLIEPLAYEHLIWLMSKSYLVLTDSGGIQEEAPSLGKPVLVMRNVTERTEGIKAGTAKLVGTDQKKIITETASLLNDQKKYLKMSKANNPYGSGDTADKILKIFIEVLSNANSH